MVSVSHYTKVNVTGASGGICEALNVTGASGGICEALH